jgi:hypothetical protein
MRHDWIDLGDLEIPVRVSVDDLIANSNVENLVEFVKGLEIGLASMDFTEPLYQHLKEVMKKEMPENL